MELNLVSPGGKASKKTMVVADTIFNKEFNQPLVHQVVIAYQAGARQGTVAQKSRSEVSGGGSKPWRQKGTGRARAGTIRSPIWRTGGQTFAAKPQDYSQKVNRKMYRGAMRSILSELLRQGRLYVVDAFDVETPKTRELVKKLEEYNLSDVLIITETESPNLYLAARNLVNISVIEPEKMNPVSLLRYENILTTESVLKKIEEVLG